MIRSLALLLALATACSSTTTTPHPSDDASRDIDRFVSQVLRDIPEVPSVGIAIVRDGQPYYVRSFGFADVEKKLPADAQTGYYIGSTTKAYTGLACAILAQRGFIDLDAPITKYLPVTMNGIDTQKLTLRSLLTHNSGITNGAIGFRTAFTGERIGANDVARLLSFSKPRKSGFEYDNLGYVVASAVIERVTGKPWQDALDELVFTPLGMQATTAYMSIANRHPLASPYEWDREARVVRTTYVKNDAMMHAAGGIVTTPADLAKWIAANLNRGRVGSKQVIPAAAFDEIQRQQIDVPVTKERFAGKGYGFGWYQGTYGEDDLLFHQGGFEGWRSNFSFMPKRNIGVGVMVNAGPFGVPTLSLIAAYIYDRLLEKPGANESSAQELAKFKDRVKEGRERYVADVQKRLQRPWMLQHPNNTYAGVYDNPAWGTLRIEPRGDKLVASLANLSAVLEAFTEPETARVELVPRNGTVLRFTFNGDAVESVTWDDEVFKPVR